MLDPLLLIYEGGRNIWENKALRIKRKNSFQKTFFYLTDVSEEAVAPLQFWAGEVMCGAL